MLEGPKSERLPLVCACVKAFLTREQSKRNSSESMGSCF